MAWLFGLSAEFGDNRDGLAAFARRFEDEFGCSSRIFDDSDSCAWVSVFLPDQSGIDPEATASPDTVSRLYEELRRCDGFRFALVGLEVEEFRHWSELAAAPADVELFPGLVLSSSAFDELGAPDGFLHFSPGYMWLPVLGIEAE